MIYKFSKGDTIVTYDSGVCRKGVIGNVIDEVNPPILLVKFEDSDEYEKITVDQVIPDSVKGNEPEKCKSCNKSEITITPEEFRRIALELATEVCDGNLTIGLAFAVYSAELHKALFGVKSDDD
jgi:hypothetical protein